MGKITQYLDSEDFFNLRLSCLVVRSRTEPAFLRRYFWVREHLLTRPGLQALLDIATHPKLGRVIRAIIINPRTISDENLDIDHPAIVQHFAQCDEIYPTGIMIFFLREALVSAIGCDTFIMDDISPENSWGRASLERATGQPATCSWDALIERNEYLGLAQRHAMYALMDSGRTICALGLNPALPTTAFEFYDEEALRLGNSNWVTMLEDLQMKLFVAYPTFRINHITNFVNMFVRLQHLRLACNPFGYGLLDEDASPDSQVAKFRDLARDVELPCLQSLKLEGFKCVPADLMVLLYQHRVTLTQVFLHRIGLSGSTGLSWQWVLGGIRQELQVQRLCLDHCAIVRPPRFFSNHMTYHGGTPIYFHDATRLSYDIEVIVTTNGSLNRLRQWLKEGFMLEHVHNPHITVS